jgi:hypothetical protein
MSDDQITETTVPNQDVAPSEETQLEGGAYEVLRTRLLTIDKELHQQLDAINGNRQEVFGGTESAITGNERIKTEHTCVSRDIVSIGQTLLLGYNVSFGLKTETALTDVFMVYTFDGKEFHEGDMSFVGDETFVRDFTDLYKFYRSAKFMQFTRDHKSLLMVFQIGERLTDVKVFRWAINKDDTLTYIDDRGDGQLKLPTQHDFVWTETTRDDQRAGLHPHVSIDDKIFVEAVGGDITIKVEDNTESGQGIYAEPVDERDQTLDDGEIYYCILENLILLKIKPYLEDYRYLVFNRKSHEVERIDSIGNACVQLPEGHGLIFPRGFYLQNGVNRQFQEDLNMVFLESQRSPNGEDLLYVFYDAATGRYVLVQYNLIAKSIENPIFCHGYTLYDDGTLVLFNAPDEEPKRVHPMQIWQTPFYGETHEVVKDTSSFLYKIGNRDLVRGLSDCFAISRLVNSETMSLMIYQDIIIDTSAVLDHFLWLDNDEIGLKPILLRTKEAALAAVQEFEKVVRIRENTEAQIEENRRAVEEAIRTWMFKKPTEISGFVELLHDLRSRRGHVITLRDLRYADPKLIDTIEEQLEDATKEVAQACVDFLLQPAALDPYVKKVGETEAAVEAATKIAELKPVEEELDTLGGRLDMLTDIVNQLNIEDATQTVRIVDTITEVYAGVNRVKAVARNRRRDLSKTEATAEFAAQYKLISQSITNYIGICDTPEKCDEFLTKIMVTIEELEGRFADFDEYVDQLAEKREEAYTAFTNRKQVLDEDKKRRITSLVSSAGRIIKGVQHRAEQLESVDDVNGYFATDMMVMKLKDTIAKLRDFGESVKAEDLDGQLKSSKNETLRRLRDKLELFSDGDNVISLGGHKFSVNTQPLDLTTVLRDGETFFHLTGTDFYEQIKDPEFLATRELWDQQVVSENDEVCRAEYLAYAILQKALDNEDGLTLGGVYETVTVGGSEAVGELVRKEAATRHSEGYEKGIHDRDAALILAALVQMYNDCGLLRYDSESRGLAMLFWAFSDNETAKERLRNRLRSFGQMSELFGLHERSARYIAELRDHLTGFFSDAGLEADSAIIDGAAEFLFEFLQAPRELVFPVNARARELHRDMIDHLTVKGVYRQLTADLEGLAEELNAQLSLIGNWVNAFLSVNAEPEDAHFGREMIALIACGERITTLAETPVSHSEVTDLMAQHRIIEDKTLAIDLDSFLMKMRRFEAHNVPMFQSYIKRRSELVHERRDGMRLEEFKSVVMGSFVRNQLINDVYMPLVGANFAKQMGATGDKKRTDLMGLLLLISPPGYGKTTLMEYMANRLGLTFMKINGPAIGHQVGSLDPSEAPNATSRQELNKLNLAFEMGNNVMIYLDDIQHLNPELLQKFISLCDAQRKIEGVYQGVSRTYDLRGKKVCVVMAGNPYTESGEKFQIPDMLANRADTYNLGDVSSSAADAFALSFIENAMTSNSALSKISSHGHDDIYRFMKVVESGSPEGIDFDYPYSAAEVDEIVSVLSKLKRVQETVLKVNQQYIYSAAQSDDYRTEPSFKMQGSYRNMCRMAEKVYPVMTDEEVDQVIVDHYYNEAQTLTTGTEANLLKFKEMTGRLAGEEQERWDKIKREFGRRQLVSGVEEGDQLGQIMAQLSGFNSNMGDIRAVLEQGVGELADEKAPDYDEILQQMSTVNSSLLEMKTTMETGMKTIADAGSKSGGKAQAAPAVTVDLKPLVTQLKAMAKQQNAVQVNAQFPEAYGEAWDRQVKLLESLLPVLHTFKTQSEMLVELKSIIEAIEVDLGSSGKK